MLVFLNGCFTFRALFLRFPVVNSKTSCRYFEQLLLISFNAVALCLVKLYFNEFHFISFDDFELFTKCESKYSKMDQEKFVEDSL